MLQKLPQGVGRALQGLLARWDQLLIARCRAARDPKPEPPAFEPKAEPVG
jgi:hypothetical protein